MPKVTIDGIEIELSDTETLNGIQAARRAGIEIPHYCWHPGLSVVASCRMCLVESGRKDPNSGDIAMVPKLVPACQTPATDGTVFVTDSDKVREARAMVEEDLLLRHPIDCPICDKAGECLLQDYHFQHGRDARRADIQPFTSRRRPVGDTVTLFVDRCVMCSRCVRFTHEITGTHELMIVNRGTHEEIDVFPGYPLANKMSGNVVDLCPVGALGDVDFLYSQRVWFMQNRPHVCGGCSAGCSISVDENQDRIYRLKPRENPRVNQWWMCDDGRYGFRYVHDFGRQLEPAVRRADGSLERIDWFQVPSRLKEDLQGAGRLGVLLSPFLTVEEAFLLANRIRDWDAGALVGRGPVPVDGEDETFPNGFTIRAEKCPNRRGIEKVVAHFDGIQDHREFLERLDKDRVAAVWITGGYPSPWHSQEFADQVASNRRVVVQDLFESPLWNIATYRLPGAAFPERAGSVVNHKDYLQSFDWAIRPPAGVMTEGQLLWRLSDRGGLYRPSIVLREVAERIGYFSAALEGVPELGLDLKVNQLAGV